MSQSRSRAARKSSLRDELARKRSRTTSVTFPVGEAGDKAARELEEAQQAFQLLKVYQAQGKEIDLAKPEAAVKKAASMYEKNSITLTFRGLSPDEVDTLRSEFTVDDEDKDAKFDTKGYTCALLAAATVDSDLTADEWRHELYESGRWSEGEVRKIGDAAHDAYSEAPAPGIPKD